MKPKTLSSLLAIAVAGVALALLVRRGAEPPPARERSAAVEAPAPSPPPPLEASRPDSTPPLAAPPPPRPSPPSRPRAPRPLTEDQLMQRLRDIGSTDPMQSLRLAEEGNRRFPDSPDAPERASVIVRSLSSLGRHDEARAEALRMEKAYPSSDWTQDVHRHMLVNPPTHPTERGYGKTYELE